VGRGKGGRSGADWDEHGVDNIQGKVAAEDGGNVEGRCSRARTGDFRAFLCFLHHDVRRHFPTSELTGSWGRVGVTSRIRLPAVYHITSTHA
jgi:hypothetical protein